MRSDHRSRSRAAYQPAGQKLLEMLDSLEYRILTLFEDATELFKQGLQSVSLPVPADRPAPEEDYVRLAVVMLAFACYSAAETIRVLMRTNVT
jgi:hypothetical protein